MGDTERQWAIENGIIQGDENDRYMWQDFMTREQLAAVAYRLHEEKN